MCRWTTTRAPSITTHISVSIPKFLHLLLRAAMFVCPCKRRSIFRYSGTGGTTRQWSEKEHLRVRRVLSLFLRRELLWIETVRAYLLPWRVQMGLALFKRWEACLA